MTKTKTLSIEDELVLINAKKKMEDIGWAMKGLNKVGNVIEGRLQMLPKKRQKWLQELSFKVLHSVVRSNLFSMKKNGAKTAPWNRTYKALVTSSGAIGGAFGATAFAVDLGITTKLMMRSIMDIARSEGEDLNEMDTQLACLQVFALGGKSKHDNSLETGYYASRIAVGSAVKGGTKTLGALVVGSPNPILAALAVIASRFSIQVSEKFVAQAVPVLGAAGGASINLAFLSHFQQMAHAHFSIRRLERIYGEELVKESYEQLDITSKK
ncbi:EcsC family protein [Aggregatimonas sangjinii]|uniref:EcsC family protein n=1 Tax=Aggregatimonas sangjinii TaxID=2583587 RepID=A0A5B7SX43_9FLAO|nr:EcsC family protein [Aggregatimonas sangjinii]QCX01541.1 EcsC family protein [Aggregatimonas sangjinii]